MSEIGSWPSPHDLWLADLLHPGARLLCWSKNHPEEGFWITEVHEDYDSGNIYYEAHHAPRPNPTFLYMHEWNPTWGWRVLRATDATGEPINV